MHADRSDQSKPRISTAYCRRLAQLDNEELRVPPSSRAGTSRTQMVFHHFHLRGRPLLVFFLPVNLHVATYLVTRSSDTSGWLVYPVPHGKLPPRSERSQCT